MREREIHRERETERERVSERESVMRERNTTLVVEIVCSCLQIKKRIVAHELIRLKHI